MRSRISVFTGINLLATMLWPAIAMADYHFERITGVLNQPTYVTQAPGDPTNILYYTTRISTSVSGFGSANSMGSVWRYTVTTRAAVAVLALGARAVQDD